MGLIIYWSLTLNFIFLLLIILFIYSILWWLATVSNIFILFLFFIYLNFKYIINSLSEIKFKKQNMEIINKFKPTIFSHSRSFSTFTKNSNIKELEINPLAVMVNRQASLQDNLSYNSDKSFRKQLKKFK